MILEHYNSSSDEEFHDLEVLNRVFQSEQSVDNAPPIAEENVGEIVVNPTESISHPSEDEMMLLESNFINYDNYHSSFHCAKCNMVLQSRWSEHFRKNHKILFDTAMKSQINLLMNTYLREVSYTPGCEIRKFKFLPVKSGFQCSYCHSIFKNIRSAKRICSKGHSSASEFLEVTYQDLGYIGKPIYIRVNSTEVLSTEEAQASRLVLDIVLNDVADILKPSQAPESQHQLNIFYVERAWYTEGDPFQNYDIVKIVKVPREGDADFEFFYHLTYTFIDVLKDMHLIDEQLRRALRDPAKHDEDHRGRFHVLTSPNSEKLYAKFFASFILGMRRMIQNPSRCLRIDISIEQLIQRLGDTPSIDRIFQLLSAVIRELPTDSADTTMIGIVFLRFFCK